MTPDELLRKEAAKWLQQAAKDRNAAQLLLEAEPSRSVFFSQQAAEKATKAFLTFHQVVFRKTHDLKDLGSQCATVDPPGADPGGCRGVDRLRFCFPVSRCAVRAGCRGSGGSIDGRLHTMRRNTAAHCARSGVLVHGHHK